MKIPSQEWGRGPHYFQSIFQKESGVWQSSGNNSKAFFVAADIR